jgi:hypothetical protein
MGAIASLRKNSLNLQVRGMQVQTLDYWTEKAQGPKENNQQLMDEVAAIQKKLVRPGAVAPIEMKANKTIAKIAPWLFLLVLKDLR